MVQLILYSTLGCHLCDEAIAVIQDVLAQPAFAGLDIAIGTVDIAEDEALMQRYGEIIPVVKLVSHAESEDPELHWPFDQQMFVNWWIKSL